VCTGKDKTSDDLDPRVLFLDGLECYKKGLFSEALKRWRALNTFDPCYPNLAMFLNVCERQELSSLRDLENLDQGGLAQVPGDEVELLNSVGSAAEDFRIAMESDNREEAESVLIQLSLDRPADEQALKFLVNSYQTLSNPVKMVESANKLLQLAPFASRTYLILGRVHSYLDQPEEAISNFRKAIRLNPDGFAGYYQMGVALLALENRREASEYFHKAMKLNPKLEKVKQIASKVELDMKDLEAKILSSYEKLSEENRYPDVLYRLGVLYRKTGRLEKAFAVIEEALELNESYREARFEKARLQIELENYQQACDTLLSLIAEQEEPAGFDNVRQFLQTGYFEEASKEILRLLKLETDYGAVHIELGKEYVKAEQWEKAEDELSKGIYLSPHYPDGHHYQGLCLERRGKLESALAKFQEGLDLNPMYEDATLAAARVMLALKRNSDAKKLLKRMLAVSQGESDGISKAKALLESLL
jgi:tetratricopeptide (TPR) repeat protein